ncbi:MAG: thiolase domain-containing protein [Candidatus Oleimicrobiaceae bacterium]
MAREVAIIGVGLSPWGELWDKSLRDLFVEAALNAIADAGVDHIDSLYVGCMSSGLFVGQEHLASLLTDYLGMCPIPAARVESACASGGLAMRCGFLEVASGMSDLVLVGGVEKMTDIGTDQATAALSTAADQEQEVFYGVTFPALYAMMARAHMAQYGTTREQLAQVAVKNHRHGALNPHAQFRHQITIDDVLNSVMVADPLRVLDCSPITDGAAAVVICSLETAKKVSKKPIVKIAGIGHATDTIALHSREDLTFLRSASLAAERALKMAKKTPAEVHLIELHDCFTIAELIVLESMGFVPRGEAAAATTSGVTSLGGKLPVNPSGGLKAKGHPVGATGVAQIVEVVQQLRGEAGDRQVEGARVGLTQNMGGTGGSSLVHILEVV